MTSSLFRRALMASAFGLITVSTSVHAANRFDVSDMWDIAMNNEAEQPICIVQNQYDNGFEVSFEVQNGAISSLSIDMQQDIFTTNEGYTASFSVDGRDFGNQTGGAIDAQTLSFDMSAFDAFRDALTGGNELGVNVESNPFVFSLKHLDQAAQGNAACFDGIQEPVQVAEVEPVQDSLKDREVYIRRDRSANDTEFGAALNEIAPAAGDIENADVPEIAAQEDTRRAPEPIDLLKAGLMQNDAPEQAVLISRVDESMKAGRLGHGDARPDQIAKYEAREGAVVSPAQKPEFVVEPEMAQEESIEIAMQTPPVPPAPIPSQEALSVPSIDVPVRDSAMMGMDEVKADVKTAEIKPTDLAPYEPIKTPLPYAPIVNILAPEMPQDEVQMDIAKAQEQVVRDVEMAEQDQGIEPVTPSTKPIDDAFLNAAIAAAKAQQDTIIEEPLPPTNIAAEDVAPTKEAPQIIAAPAPIIPETMGMRVAMPKPVDTDMVPTQGVQATQHQAAVEKLYRLENGRIEPVAPMQRKQAKQANVNDVLDASTMAEIPIRVVRSDDIFVSRPSDEPAMVIVQAKALESTPTPVKTDAAMKVAAANMVSKMSTPVANNKPIDMNTISAPAPQSSMMASKSQIQNWSAVKGEKIQTVLSRWADVADMDLRWEADSNPALSQDINVNGDVKAAVQLLLAQNKDQSGLHGDFVQDMAQKKQPFAPVVPAVVSSPQPPMHLASVSKQSQPWSVPSAPSLRQTLESWSARENVKLIWKANRDFSVTEPTMASANFDQALGELLNRYNHDPVRPVGHLNVDPVTKQKLLVIDIERVL